MTASVRFFYLYRFASRLYFHLPVLFIYFYNLGLPLWEIELLLAVYGVVIMVTSNINARLLGHFRHRTVIALAELVKALGLILLLSGHHFPVLLAGQIVSGFGYSLSAGTDSSLLRHLIAEPQSYKRAESGSNSYMFLSVLISGVVGSILFHIHSTYAFTGSVLSNLLAVLFVLLIRETRSPDVTRESPSASSAIENAPAHSGKPVFTNEQKYWMSYYAFSRAFALAPFVGFLPFYFYKKENLSLYMFGFVLSLFTLFGFFASRYVVRWGQSKSPDFLSRLSFAASFLSLTVFGLSQNITTGIVAIILLGLASGCIRPLTMSNLNQTEMTPKQRTTLLSTMERQYGLYNALLLLIGGWALGYLGFRWFMLLLAIAYALILLSIRRAYAGTKEHPVTTGV
ncbi:MFS family permease [Paenibacillus forsythiae]|uniref:MFS family permease n=1 Tax=Paenibacillus forsythiae TaxID=365616 RepID=A0ABU3HCI3_9BACL|nr:MFS transporter [Paenibacillus forsythiae]MDT3427395.1 MFS family permease [Paenibacillus forsythiae]